MEVTLELIKKAEQMAPQFWVKYVEAVKFSEVKELSAWLVVLMFCVFIEIFLYNWFKNNHEDCDGDEKFTVRAFMFIVGIVIICAIFATAGHVINLINIEAYAVMKMFGK